MIIDPFIFSNSSNHVVVSHSSQDDAINHHCSIAGNEELSEQMINTVESPEDIRPVVPGSAVTSNQSFDAVIQRCTMHSEPISLTGLGTSSTVIYLL